MKLDAGDANKLFKLMDKDNSGELDIDEFVSGCYQLQGESKSVDVKLMQLEVEKIQDDVGTLVSLVKDVRRTLEQTKVKGTRNTVGQTIGSARWEV